MNKIDPFGLSQRGNNNKRMSPQGRADAETKLENLKRGPQTPETKKEIKRLEKAIRTHDKMEGIRKSRALKGGTTGRGAGFRNFTRRVIPLLFLELILELNDAQAEFDDQLVIMEFCMENPESCTSGQATKVRPKREKPEVPEGRVWVDEVLPPEETDEEIDR